jgi:phosphoglycolate phosphatase/beta-phosphoglucomutase
MVLKAVLFDFSGVVMNDDAIREQIIGELLISENLRPKPGEYRHICLGRGDRACLTNLLSERGRIVSDPQLAQLIVRKQNAYQQAIHALAKLPIYPGVDDFIFRLQAAQIKIALIGDGSRSEIDCVLSRSKLQSAFHAILSDEDSTASKPDPAPYQQAIARLNELYPTLNLEPQHCLAIEDTPVGIQSAKQAGISVVGVANTYPFHMMQRQANWAVDYLSELELERIQLVFEGNERSLPAA